MIQIQQYGLQWTVDVPDPKRAVLKQGSRLTFLGDLSMHPFFGAHMTVNSVLAYIKENSTYRRIEYTLPIYQWFFAPELESMCDPQQVKWYHALHKVHKKNMFKRCSDYTHWRISATNLLGETISMKKEVVDMFFLIDHNAVVYMDYSRDRPTLFINDNIYDKLPDQWTIDDIHNADRDYQDQFKKEHEQLWYDIAKARQNNQPVKIVVYDNTRTAHIYTEQKTSYGIVLPIVVPCEQEQEH